MPQYLVTIFTSFTREWAVRPFLASLEALKCDLSRTEVVFIIDSPEPSLKLAVDEFLSRRSMLAKVVKINNYKPSEDLPTRRTRISQVLNQARELVGNTSYVLGLEDDTIFPPDSLKRFLEFAAGRKDFGYITGVQMGRWEVPMVGVWGVDNPSDPQKYWTPAELGTGIAECDAGGFYCFLTPTKLFKSVNHGWQEPVGADVCYGVKLRKMGYKCFVDWGVECGHHIRHSIIYPSQSKIEQIVFTKSGNGWIQS